jgi:hypothetical protein
MMKNTPRAFVGRTSFSLAGGLGGHSVRALTRELLATPGVTRVIADAVTGTVSVTVDRPVDRGDIAAAADRAGHRLSFT